MPAPSDDKKSSSRYKLLDEHELAEELGLAVKTLQKWRVYGGGPNYLKLGRAVRYARRDIEKFKREQRETDDRAD